MPGLCWARLLPAGAQPEKAEVLGSEQGCSPTLGRKPVIKIGLRLGEQMKKLDFLTTCAVGGSQTR